VAQSTLIVSASPHAARIGKKCFPGGFRASSLPRFCRGQAVLCALQGEDPPPSLVRPDQIAWLRAQSRQLRALRRSRRDLALC